MRASAAPPLLLAIDLGTQSVRALLFDARGELVARSQQVFNDYRRAQPGWMSHDGEAFWQAAASCCRALPAAERARVAALALTTQRASMLPVDAQGRCLAEAICWPDERRATQLPPLSWPWRTAFQLAGVHGTIERLQRDAELNWWAEHEPALSQQAHKFLLLSGLLTQRLTGRFVDSIGNQVGYLPFDHRRQQWAQHPLEGWKWQALAVRREQLVDLMPVGSRLGPLTAEAARHCGLAAGLPLIAAAADKACEVLGSGALAPQVGSLSFGTTATVNQTLRRYVEPEPFVPAYPAAVAGHWSLEAQIPRGFWLVSWFRDQFGHPEREAAEPLGLAPEQLFDELIADIPPGSDGLVLLPTWAPGIRTPGPEARGAVIGFAPGHTRAHLYRALLEGLAFGLREGAERLQRRSGVRFAELRASGGGAQSNAALQLAADVLQQPVARPHTHETSGLGAAMVAAVALGLHPDMPTAVAAMTRVERRFTPQPAAVRRYEQLYREVYAPLYGRLRPLFQALSRRPPA